MAGVGNLACGTGSKERQEACVCHNTDLACYLPNRAWTKSWTKFREDREQKGARLNDRYTDMGGSSPFPRLGQP